MRIVDAKQYTPTTKWIYAEGVSTETKPTTGLVTGSIFYELDTGRRLKFEAETGKWYSGGASETIGKEIAKAIRGLNYGPATNRIETLDETPLENVIVDAVGIPTYVSDPTASKYEDYELTETGWYVFARITAPEGTVVTEDTTVTGADGVIATEGADHIDVAVRFDVAAQSKAVTVDWGELEDTFVLRAADLAIRNLDYRTTFYVYDLAPFVTWQYAVTTDATAAEGKKYYTKDGNTYTAVELETGAACAAYYELVGENEYALTEDETFVDGKTYYTYNGTAYTAATVTAGDAIPPVYYNHSKAIIQGMTRNITYRLDEIIDCPQEVVLPDIEDDTHGAWFEFQLRHSGTFSMTLTVPEGVKIATEHTQSETAGFNLIDLHYMEIDNVKMWRFMNTHSSIPTT